MTLEVGKVFISFPVPHPSLTFTRLIAKNKMILRINHLIFSKSPLPESSLLTLRRPLASPLWKSLSENLYYKKLSVNIKTVWLFPFKCGPSRISQKILRRANLTGPGGFVDLQTETTDKASLSEG